MRQAQERETGLHGPLAFDLFAVAGSANLCKRFQLHGIALEIGLMAVHTRVWRQTGLGGIQKMFLNMGLVVENNAVAALKGIGDKLRVALREARKLADMAALALLVAQLAQVVAGAQVLLMARGAGDISSVGMGRTGNQTGQLQTRRARAGGPVGLRRRRAAGQLFRRQRMGLERRLADVMAVQTQMTVRPHRSRLRHGGQPVRRPAGHPDMAIRTLRADRRVGEAEFSRREHLRSAG